MRSATKVISGSPSQRESEVTPRWSAKKSSSSEGRSARPKASSRSSSPAARNGQHGQAAFDACGTGGPSGRCGRRWPAAARRRPSGEYPRCRSARRLPPRAVRPACGPAALRPRARKSEPRRASGRIRRSRLRAEGSGRRSRRRATPRREQTFRAVGVQFDAHEARHARRIAFRGGERLDTLREPLCGGGVKGVRTVRATRRRARRCVRRRCARGPGPDARSGIGRDRSKQKDFQQQFAQQFAVRRAARAQSLALGVVFAQ